MRTILGTTDPGGAPGSSPAAAKPSVGNLGPTGAPGVAAIGGLPNGATGTDEVGLAPMAAPPNM